MIANTWQNRCQGDGAGSNLDMEWRTPDGLAGVGGSLQAYETEESTPNTELLDETQKVDLISSVVLIPPCSGDFPWILVTF